jgi:hypothetical protein
VTFFVRSGHRATGPHVLGGMSTSHRSERAAVLTFWALYLLAGAVAIGLGYAADLLWLRVIGFVAILLPVAAVMAWPLAIVTFLLGYYALCLVGRCLYRQ